MSLETYHVSPAGDAPAPEDAATCLRREHRLLGRVLDACERAVAAWERAGRCEPELAAGFATVFADYGDGLHHAKEETLLFPALARVGLPIAGGPPAVMIEEHELARELLAEMVAAARAGRPATPYVTATRRFTELLRRHIDKEDHCLLGGAAALIQGDDLALLLAAYRRFDEEAVNQARAARTVPLARELCRAFRSGEVRP